MNPRAISTDGKEISEAEAAACIAAVYTYIEIEREEKARAATPELSVNRWQLAARLEATRRLPRIAAPLRASVLKRPWQTGLFPLLCTSVLSAALAAPASCVSSADDASADAPPAASAMAAPTPLAPAPFIPAGRRGKPRDRLAAMLELARSGRVPAAPGQHNVGTAAQPDQPPKEAAAADGSVYLRVGVIIGAERVEIGRAGRAALVDVASGRQISTLPADDEFQLTARGGVLTLRLNPQGQPQSEESTSERKPASYSPRNCTRRLILPPTHGAPTNAVSNGSARAGDTASGYPLLPHPLKPGSCGYLIVPYEDRGLTAVTGKLYRGALWVRSNASVPDTIDVINIVELEDYLLSVVPAEMPGAWPLEALKAQAVAARSYAAASLGKHEKEGFDVTPTCQDQLYPGVATETDATTRAVLETLGLVLKHEGKVVQAFFHSTSGGCTELSEHVWGNVTPYLKAVVDFDYASPHSAWSKTYDVGSVEAALAQPDLGQLMSILPLCRTPSQRVRALLVIGSDNVRVLTGEEFRSRLKLPSTNFNVGSGEGVYIFAGKGFGHGLGLSQWGAKTLAEHGYNAAQILAYYYKDVSIDYL